MSSTVTLANYLFQRLRQLGVVSVHGVPGDTNLPLLDYVEPSGLRWIGSANELNAAYAADGYARIKGLGVLVTTFGVGELSALNGVAGAYAERAALVHIVGTPTRAQQDSRHFVHHSIKHGDFHTFAQMYSHITIAQARLWDPHTGPEQIDEVLNQCLRYSRPVYIEFPMDLVSALVPGARLDCAIKLAGPEPTVPREDVLEKILRIMYQAKRPIILVDGESRAMGILDNVQHLIELTKWPTWTTPFGKGLLNETLSNVHGIYRGKHDDEAVRSFVAEADLILCFGPQFSSTNTYSFSSVPRAEVTIHFTDTAVQIGNETLRDIPAKYITSRLLQEVDPPKLRRYDPYPTLPRDSLLDFSEAPDDLPIAHDRLWRLVANILRPGDIVLGDTGTSGHGVREMALPAYTRLFTHATWLCVGYALPAAQGAALAQQELIASSQYFGITNARTILFIGDGGFQMTVQELATIIRCSLDIVLVLINNGGYTTERCLHGRKQGYNDIAPLKYLQVPACFGARDDIYTASARTWRELKEILRNSQFNDGQGLRMVELLMDREDAPSGGLQSALRIQKDAETVLPVNRV
ncbi:pyruvate decarboxylase [Xylariaceae sp. AK1471]|nr:pyruvate decarboxylase [Xylariaceae sp. AK1471]